MEKSNVIASKSGMGKLKRSQAIWGYGMLVPTVLLFLVFTVFPLVMGFYLSLTNFNFIEDYSWAGLANYKYIFDPVTGRAFMHSLLNVLVYALMSVPLTVILSLLVANLVNSKLRGVKVFRALYYLPAVTGGVATAFIWQWLMNGNYGLFNSILKIIGIKPIDWLNMPSYFSMFSISIVSVWGGIGGNMLIYLAALKGINDELYEAADIDGASKFRKLINITVPLISPTTYFIVTMSVIGSFQLFDIVYLIAGGNSQFYTQTPVALIYNNGVRIFEGGRGAAMSVILFGVIMVCTFITQAFMREEKS